MSLETTHAGLAAEPRQAPADVARSLFWDDVRAGLKIVCVGLILLLVGELSVQFHAHEFLVNATIVVGGLVSLFGLGICTAMPKATGARPGALLAVGIAALWFLALLISLFSPIDLPIVGTLVVCLGYATLLVFAIVLSKCTAYLGHRPLTAAASSYLYLVSAFGLIVVLAVLTPLAEIRALRVLVDLLAIGIVGIFVYVAWGTSDAIQRARQGQPVEASGLTDSPEELAAEERLRSEANAVHAPAAHHFSEADVRYFHADDSRAAGAIVVLMAGIFAVGIVLYTIVAWSTAP